MGGDAVSHIFLSQCGTVSIHAPAWGATRTSPRMVWYSAFQSTPPRGGRHFGTFQFNIDFCVSIHAPAWGATSGRITRSGRATSFNPRPRVGGDVGRREHVRSGVAVSIHAPAWGATRGPARQIPFEHGFQSTPPRGGRLEYQLNMHSRPEVSIHAPAWGATPGHRPPGGTPSVSIHAPAWGATG